MHLSMLSPTIPHMGYIGAKRGDLTPTGCLRGWGFDMRRSSDVIIVLPRGFPPL